MLHADDRRLEHRDVECVELLAVLIEIEVGGRAVGADDDVASPRGEVERESYGFASLSDHDDFLSDALVTVAVGADVRARAIHTFESGNVGPHVLESDGKQQPSRVDLPTITEDEIEVLLVVAGDAFTHSVHEFDAELSCLVASHAAQLRGTNARMAKKAIDTARLPVAWVAGVDEDDAMEVAGEPHARAESSGTSADDGDVVPRCLVHMTRAGQEERR